MVLGALSVQHEKGPQPKTGTRGALSDLWRAAANTSGFLLIWSELSIPFISRGIVGCWVHELFAFEGRAGSDRGSLFDG